MATVRIALANLPYAAAPDESVTLAHDAIAAAADRRGGGLCFSECYVAGSRGLGHHPPPPDAAFLDRAWSSIAEAAANASVAVVLGTERLVNGGARVIPHVARAAAEAVS